MTLLTVQEVAARVGTTPKSVRRWLKDGKIRGVRPGGPGFEWRVPEAEVRRLLKD